MSDSLNAIVERAARILGVAEADIDVNADVAELGLDAGDVQDMLEDVAEVFDAPLIDIINTLPVYRIKRGDMTMASLQDIAAFSPWASALLSELTTKTDIETLTSLAASIDAGRYVPSGRKSEDLHRPKPPEWVIAKAVGIWAAALLVPLFNVFRPCNPLAQFCFTPAAERFWHVASYSLTIAAVVTLVWLVPGLHELSDDIRKQKARLKRGAGEA
ncbi:acyl carrier protein [uncultured Tateyamaria sp.]|uniref:acyl carrier protein n=1 Tax=uncultured Tateyamaria sp. TaxID=455651 RepID=UPI0026016CA1|nr:acyl carrier protein [uncultured Tateyamaria sp.]